MHTCPVLIQYLRGTISLPNRGNFFLLPSLSMDNGLIDRGIKKGRDHRVHPEQVFSEYLYFKPGSLCSSEILGEAKHAKQIQLEPLEMGGNLKGTQRPVCSPSPPSSCRAPPLKNRGLYASTCALLPSAQVCFPQLFA